MHIVLSDEQVRVDRDVVDADRLTVLVKSGWGSLTDTQRVEATGLTARLLLRRELKGDI